MTGEKILLFSDSLEVPSGFGNNAANIAWCLAEKFDVHLMGLQTYQQHDVKLNMEGKERIVTEHPNLPKNNDVQWDFGVKSLPPLLDKLKPDILLTINDIQMVAHIPQILCPDKATLKLIDLPSKDIIPPDALAMQLEALVSKFQEKFPRNTKWIMYAPEDGHPPMPNWGFYYQFADSVVAFAKYGQWVFKKYFGMDVPYIYHATDSNVFKPMDKSPEAEGKFILGDINRNQPRKQPLRALEAFAKFAKDKEDVFLHMQMDWRDQFGWPIDYFIDHVYQIPARKCIPPKPFGMPREEVVKTFNDWDVHLMPTAGEGFGIPFIEAAICGIPTIGTGYTTTDELIIEGAPGPRGISCGYDIYWEKIDEAAVGRALIDIGEFVEAMNRYYYDRDLLKEHGKNGRKWALENATLKVIEPQWINHIKKVLNEKT